MNDTELVDTLLAMLQVGDRATLSALLTDPDELYDPTGCGCCSDRPSPVFDSWSPEQTAKYPGRKYRMDDDFVMWLR